jgi:hypothetical protein
VAVLILLLLLAGVYDEVIFAFFTSLWQKAFALFGIGEQADALQHGIHRRITRRALPAVITYAAIYVSICLLVLRLLLRDPAQWRLTLRLYAGVGVAYIVIVLLGKLAGDVVWAYRLSRHLIDFVVSPIPIAGLFVLFRAGFGPHSSNSGSN